jgi:large subunit ribosomal protein L3
MKKFLLGEKIGMTQILDSEGAVVPVTVVKVGPCSVLSIREIGDESRRVVLLGYGDKKAKSVTKPVAGFFNSISVSPKKHIRGFQTTNFSELSVAQELDATLFEEGEKISVRGVSSGKGFAGTIKRHNFRRGPRSHGSKNYRAPGSIGAGTTPGRVLRGKRMAGHMGNANVTVRNLSVVRVDSEKGFVFLKGAVPGKRSGLLEIFS